MDAVVPARGSKTHGARACPGLLCVPQLTTTRCCVALVVNSLLLLVGGAVCLATLHRVRELEERFDLRLQVAASDARTRARELSTREQESHDWYARLWEHT